MFFLQWKIAFSVVNFTLLQKVYKFLLDLPSDKKENVNKNKEAKNWKRSTFSLWQNWKRCIKYDYTYRLAHFVIKNWWLLYTKTNIINLVLLCMLKDWNNSFALVMKGSIRTYTNSRIFCKFSISDTSSSLQSKKNITQVIYQTIT
jgi:hypothetical protein